MTGSGFAISIIEICALVIFRLTVIFELNFLGENSKDEIKLRREVDEEDGSCSQTS